MAFCPSCSVEFRDGKFTGAHDPSCPHYQKVGHVAQSRGQSEDKKDLFLAFWKLLNPDGLLPEGEYKFHPVRKWPFDWAWPDQLVAVEVDGNAWHVKGGGRHMQDSDLEKLNQAQLLGWRVFRFSPGMLRHDPQSCIDLIREVLDG